MLLGMVVLALALSFDCMVAGFSYGMRKIELPWYGILIICSCSGIVLAASMLAGSWIGQFIAANTVRFLGAGLLIVLGLSLLWKSLWEMLSEADSDAMLFQWEIASLGIVIQILREPHLADLDCSGNINSKEALRLGIAMSLDSCGAGIGMAWMGYSPVWTCICTAVSSFVCLSLGLYLGEHAGEMLSCGHLLKLLPGCLMIGIGMVRLFF